MEKSWDEVGMLVRDRGSFGNMAAKGGIGNDSGRVYQTRIFDFDCHARLYAKECIERETLEY